MRSVRVQNVHVHRQAAASIYHSTFAESTEIGLGGNVTDTQWNSVTNVQPRVYLLTGAQMLHGLSIRRWGSSRRLSVRVHVFRIREVFNNN